MGSFVMPVGIETAFIVKAIALIGAIEIACKRKWFPLWVDTDSQVLLQKVRSKYTCVRWRNKAKWRQCLRTIDDRGASVTHGFKTHPNSI